jgi:hypothetical protein
MLTYVFLWEEQLIHNYLSFLWLTLVQYSKWQLLVKRTI